MSGCVLPSKIGADLAGAVRLPSCSVFAWFMHTAAVPVERLAVLLRSRAQRLKSGPLVIDEVVGEVMRPCTELDSTVGVTVRPAFRTCCVVCGLERGARVWVTEGTEITWNRRCIDVIAALRIGDLGARLKTDPPVRHTTPSERWLGPARRLRHATR